MDGGGALRIAGGHGCGNRVAARRAIRRALAAAPIESTWQPAGPSGWRPIRGGFVHVG